MDLCVGKRKRMLQAVLSYKEWIKLFKAVALK